MTDNNSVEINNDVRSEWIVGSFKIILEVGGAVIHRMTDDSQMETEPIYSIQSTDSMMRVYIDPAYHNKYALIVAHNDCVFVHDKITAFTTPDVINYFGVYDVPELEPFPFAMGNDNIYMLLDNYSVRIPDAVEIIKPIDRITHLLEIDDDVDVIYYDVIEYPQYQSTSFWPPILILLLSTICLLLASTHL